MSLNLMGLFGKGSPECLCWVRLARVICYSFTDRFDPHAVSIQETDKVLTKILFTGNVVVQEEPEPRNQLQGMRSDPPGRGTDNEAAHR
ncbi:hypothetical protein AMECASPLE_037380 [Ameca splendens]|uniref:Uncharacterized protein n=1 Tax=Ameca splendens TaxID=208324 RepID=A0ABV0YW97_9TELE